MPDYYTKTSIPETLDTVLAWPILALRWIWYGYTFRRIRLLPDKYAIVEPADFYKVNKHIWWARKNGKHYYVAVHFLPDSNNGSLVYMHRELINPPKNLVVDHINRNPLDNRRANLRLATISQNNLNYSGRRGKTSKYKGVSWYRASKRWQAKIQANKKRTYLGYFDSETEAAKAYDAAAKKYHGEFAYLNFPPDDNPKNLKAILKKFNRRFRGLTQDFHGF